MRKSCPAVHPRAAYGTAVDPTADRALQRVDGRGERQISWTGPPGATLLDTSYAYFVGNVFIYIR